MIVRFMPASQVALVLKAVHTKRVEITLDSEFRLLEQMLRFFILKTSKNVLHVLVSRAVSLNCFSSVMVNCALVCDSRNRPGRL